MEHLSRLATEIQGILESERVPYETLPGDQGSVVYRLRTSSAVPAPLLLHVDEPFRIVCGDSECRHFVEPYESPDGWVETCARLVHQLVASDLHLKVATTWFGRRIGAIGFERPSGEVEWCGDLRAIRRGEARRVADWYQREAPPAE